MNVDIFEQLALSDIQANNLSGKKDEPYRNALGQLLPWEEPEYLKSLEKERNQIWLL